MKVQESFTIDGKVVTCIEETQDIKLFSRVCDDEGEVTFYITKGGSVAIQLKVEADYGAGGAYMSNIETIVVED